jgi:hypothetical protein
MRDKEKVNKAVDKKLMDAVVSAGTSRSISINPPRTRDVRRHLLSIMAHWFLIERYLSTSRHICIHPRIYRDKLKMKKMYNHRI